MKDGMSHRIALIAACAQVPLLGIIFFGDFGFYFLGAMGDWNAWISWIFVYLIALAVGMLTALIAQRRALAILQFTAPLLLTGGWWLYLSIPDPTYNPAEYQFLVGKTLDEVEQILPPRRGHSRGLDGCGASQLSKGEMTEYGFQTYNGMEILFSKNEDRVIEVNPWPPEY